MTAKLVGIGVILMAGVMLRSLLCDRRRGRLLVCEELYRFLLHIRTRISCYLDPPSRLHIGFESLTLSECGFLGGIRAGKSLLDGLEASAIPDVLSEEELHAAREVLSTVGTGYMDEQLRLLDGGIDAFSSLLVKEREACARDVKLINTLSASLSVGIAIILI